MRLLVVGLVLIIGGIAVTEYARRHPSEQKQAEVKGAKKVKSAPTAPPTMKALIETVSPTPEVAAGSFDVQALVTTSADAAPGFKALLRGPVKARELRTNGADAVLVLEQSGKTALVRVSVEGTPTVLTVRAEPVAAIAIDTKANMLVWAEAGQVKRVSLTGGDVKTVIAFTRALVTSVAAHDGKVVASLVPRDGDPFGSDPNGAVVSIDGDDVTLLAVEQIRPREVLFDGRDETFFVAGYPSGLTRAALDGSFTARIAERADGPVALENDGITYRLPGSSPELKHGARAGGAVKSLARVDAEWLAVHQGVARYTTTGIAPRLYEAKGDDSEPTELVALKGAVKGLAWNGARTWLLTADDEGLVTLQVQ